MGCVVHGVANTQTRLGDFCFHFLISLNSLLMVMIQVQVFTLRKAPYECLHTSAFVYCYFLLGYFFFFLRNEIVHLNFNKKNF